MKRRSKKVSETQDYENYWKLTVEYSDINGPKFINTLKIIVRFIDNNESLSDVYDSTLYKKLQKKIEQVYPKASSASTRKSINQFIKLGFIYPGLRGYVKETKDFLKAKTDRERSLIFSEIYYKYANFNSSVKKDETNIKQINFFLKTLMHHPEQKLTKDEIVGLIATDITLYRKGYLNIDELNSAKKITEVVDFESRKYNQINYFIKFLDYVPGIFVKKGEGNDIEVHYIEDDFTKIKDNVNLKRDPTLFRIMREKVKDESNNIYGNLVCYFTKRPQKGLVVSHIVGLQEALNNGDIFSAYNPNNALLLEPNVDAYFDKFDLTFDAQTGEVIYGKNVYDEFKDENKNNRIDKMILNDDRKKYLEQHNLKFKEKNFK